MKKKYKIALCIIPILFIILFFSYEYILRQIGHFLVLEQEPQKSDVIVVLNGRDTERALAAVDLYNHGYADLIVLARGCKQPLDQEFLKRIKKDFSRKIFFQRAIEAIGIPEHSFKLIGDGITSTYDEAKVTKIFLVEKGYKTMLLVTSKWHSKRAYLTFKSVLKQNDDVRIVIHPSKYDTFDPNTWWKNEVDAESVFREYSRLVYYVLTFRISPIDMVKR